MNKLLDWLKNSGGDVGIFDATNTTDERRRKVLAHAMEYFGGAELEDNPLQVLFIESVCDDPKVWGALVFCFVLGFEALGHTAVYRECV